MAPSSPVQSTSTATTSGVWRPKSQAIVPSNTISFGSTTIRARIDATLPVQDVVRQLCISFSIQDPPLMWSLRTSELEGDVLVTDENLRDVVDKKTPIRLAPSPAILSTTAITSLSFPSTTASALKLTLFSLSKYLREPAFTAEFVAAGGLRELILVVDSLEGNSLAYALGAVQVLMEQGDAGGAFEASFIRRIIAIIASPSPPINISRPSAAILRTLIPGAGFDMVYNSIKEQPQFLSRVVGRLQSQEGGEVLSSLMLINSILAAATSPEQTNEATSDFSALGVRAIIQSLMVPPSDPDHTGSLLDFQSNLARALFHLHRSSVSTTTNPLQSRALREVWETTGLDARDLADSDTEDGWAEVLGLERTAGGRGRVVWRTGQLGLDCLHSFATEDPKDFSRLVVDQLSRADVHRCPIGLASNSVIDTLLDHWEISDASSSTRLAPLLLSFTRVHHLALRFFLRMWTDAGAVTTSATDLPRVGSIVRSQIAELLRDEAGVVRGGLDKAWKFLEDGLLRSEYRVVKARMIKETEASDDITKKLPIRNLRSTIHDECHNFVRHQRINCLLEGAWFKHGTLVASLSKGAQRNVPRGWTFVRLSPNRKHLAFTETQHQLSVKPTMEELNEHIDLSLVSDIATRTCYATVDPAPALARHDGNSTLRSSVSSERRKGPSELSFSLLAGSETSVLDLVALNRTQLSEWLDGINALRSDFARVATSETKDLVDQLTTIGLKLRLLDLQGEAVVIPNQLYAPPPPSNFNFAFQ